MVKTEQPDNRDQIIRLDARGCFVEVKNDCFQIDKVHLQFVAYDKKRPKGQRYTANIHIYIDVPEFLVLAQEGATGALHARMQQYRQAKKQDPLFEHMGGTSAEQLQHYGRPRPDGMSLSRVAKLIWADRADYLFVADSGPGEQNAQGLIVPRFGKNPEQHVAVSLGWRQVNQLLLTTKEHYTAWLSAKYAAEWAQQKPKTPGDQDSSEKNQEHQVGRPGPVPSDASSPVPSAPSPPVRTTPPSGFAEAFGSINGIVNGSTRADDTRMF